MKMMMKMLILTEPVSQINILCICTKLTSLTSTWTSKI